jgi:hypothetical protein
MGEMNAYRIFLRKPKIRNLLGGREVRGRL